MKDILENNKLIFDLEVSEEHFSFGTSFDEAIFNATNEIESLKETIDAAQRIKPDCDKLDYALAASIGALCGIIDIFLVGKPKESKIGEITDKWFADCTISFAKLFDKEGKIDGSLTSALKVLEKKFKIPYDQTGLGGAAKDIFDLNPQNHHLKSLGHNPTLLGVFFSILDQFTNQSHFVTAGKLISLQEADGIFELQGSDVPSKIFCGFINWFGHIVSDASGSSGSKGRGMGIPAPFLAWTNDLIVIQKNLQLSNAQFGNNLNELALKVYKEGFDLRFSVAQMIPIFVNEIIVRFIYSVRRMIKYYSETDKDDRTMEELWKQCKPFSNATVKRMLTVAHGTFCLLDVGDATMRGIVNGGGAFNVEEFVMRLNIIGVGRFAISLYGEGKRAIILNKAKDEADFAEYKIVLVGNYLEGLLELSKIYDDRKLVNFIDDFKNSNSYKMAFKKSAELAELRNVPAELILKDKKDIDAYFRGELNV